jgi:hypothetical protein
MTEERKKKSEKLLFNYCKIMKRWKTKEKEKQESKDRMRTQECSERAEY